MAHRVYCLTVMRQNLDSPWSQGPNPAYSAARILLVTVGLLGAIMSLLVSITYPIVALGIVTLAIGAYIVRQSLAARRAVRRKERSRQYCVPGTEVCIKG